MKEIAYIFIGGGVGSVLRYLAQISINERMSGIGFPFSWGTFIVNIAGSLLIGLFYSISERWNLWRIYHFFYLFQRRIKPVERRILRYIPALCLIEHRTGISSGIGRRSNRKAIGIEPAKHITSKTIANTIIYHETTPE